RDFDRVPLVIERYYGADRPEDFFPSDARVVVHVVEDRRLHVVALRDVSAFAADGQLGLLFTELLILAHSIVLSFADERTHFGVPTERRTQRDLPCLFGHRVDKLLVDLPFDKDATAR